MLRIDAHQHFWIYDPVRDSWINDEMAAIKKDFLPANLESLLKNCGLDGCVAVQADQSEAETEFLLKHAAEHAFIKGVVGWVDLQAGNLEQRLGYYSRFEKLKGFRHVLQGEPQRDFMLRPAFLNGIKALKKFGYTYDILVYPDQLKYIPEFVARFPDQPFVIDHLAKPFIKDQLIDQWAADIKVVATFPNVFCKLSGMVTEADWKRWEVQDFKPYLDIITDAFGTNRIMYGSDWPVCLVAAGYGQVYNAVADYFAGFSEAERGKVFGGNAVNFYKL